VPVLLLALIVLAGGAAGALVLLAGDDDASGAPSSSTAVAAGPAPTSAPAGGGTAGAGMFDGAATAACATDLRTLEVVLEAYALLGLGAPADEAQLVEAQYLRGDVAGFDVADGLIVPAPGGPCDPAAPAAAPAGG